MGHAGDCTVTKDYIDVWPAPLPKKVAAHVKQLVLDHLLRKLQRQVERERHRDNGCPLGIMSRQVV